MQVVLSTIGRFHTFDLARQLHRRQSLKVVFSGYPSFKLHGEGLPRDKVRTFPWLQAPFMFANPQSEWLRRTWAWHSKTSFDHFVSSNLPDCDIFHGLSGSALKSGTCAQKHGSKYICDRASSHIRFQDEILREEYKMQGVPYPGIDPRVIDAEEAEYDLADAVTVPSKFARDSFIEKGVSKNKLHLVPYGVELARFRPVSSPQPGEFRVLFAGNISLRKGIRYLLEAYEKLAHPGKKLVLAGGTSHGVEPALRKVRNRQDIVFTGHLPQDELMKVMSESHVLVLPSVEDGFGYVLAQAMACGCPVIGSTNTGARDLVRDEYDGFVVPIRDPNSILERLQRLADNPELHFTIRQRALEGVSALGGWDHYGEAIYKAFQSVLNSRPVAA